MAALFYAGIVRISICMRKARALSTGPRRHFQGRSISAGAPYEKKPDPSDAGAAPALYQLVYC
jgi:hypothetical protein